MALPPCSMYEGEMKHAFFVGAVVLLGSFGFVREAKATGTAVTNVIYLNDCEPGGCTVHQGTTSSATDTSDIGHGTLAAFSQDATTWTSVVSCVQNIMSPYDVTITETRPVSGNYLEVMVAGLSTDIGEPSDLGGLSDGECDSPGVCTPNSTNALSFAFANSAFLSGKPNDICAIALEELGGALAIDHVVDANDVMSFNENDGGIRAFHDNEACGSDCSGGFSPFGLTCSTGDDVATQTHTCESTNAATQNEVQILLGLFGAAPDAGTSSDAGTTADSGTPSADSGVSSDAGTSSDGGGASTSRVDGGSSDDGDSGDSGGCNVASSSDSLFSFGSIAFVLMTLGFRRRRSSKR